MPPYTGRFAPSPTGPLHPGSLLTAVASWCDARALKGRWLLRIEDVDTPRTQPGAADQILFALDRYGLHWDGPVVHQSQRTGLYEAALDELQRQGRVYWCTCTRSMLARGGGGLYPGTCRPRRTRVPQAAARLRVLSDVIHFEDRVFGPLDEDVSASVGDFVIFRRDHLFAYQLAVVMDDADQGVTDVVRGADLLDNTARQIYLQRCLGLPTPSYLHLPLVVSADGEKLSKQNGAAALPLDQPGPQLWQALALLGQAPPPDLNGAHPAELLAWAVAHWRVDAIPRRQKLPFAGQLGYP